MTGSRARRLQSRRGGNAKEPRLNVPLRECEGTEDAGETRGRGSAGGRLGWGRWRQPVEESAHPCGRSAPLLWAPRLASRSRKEEAGGGESRSAGCAAFCRPWDNSDLPVESPPPRTPCPSGKALTIVDPRARGRRPGRWIDGEAACLPTRGTPGLLLTLAGWK